MMGTTQVEFSNSRRSQKATRGYVDQVGTGSSSGESDAEYARRLTRRGYIEQVQSRSRTRRISTIVIIAVIVIAAAAIAGAVSYFAFSDSKLSLNDDDAKAALVANSEEGSYYLLCAANLTLPGQRDDSSDDAYVVVRIDEDARQLTFISIPSSTVVKVNGQHQPLYAVREASGDGELISQISQLLGVDIAHYVRTDAEGVVQLVELLGGVGIDIPQEIDDPNAGTAHLEAGECVLDGNQALTLLRATNYKDAYQTRADMCTLFMVNLVERAVSGEGMSLASTISDGAGAVETDWTSGDLMALSEAFGQLSDATIYSCVIPGTLTDTEDFGEVYEVDEDGSASLMEAVNAGNAPESAEGSTATVDRSLVTVDVRNGAQVTGAAARMGEMLEGYGYKVESVGNTDDGTLYPETMVIYKKDKFEIAAKAVVSDLSAGRVVNGGDYYSFDTDVLVIIGADWVPSS